MRIAVFGTLLLGLALAADQTYLGASRSMDAYRRLAESRVSEKEAIGLLSPFRMSVENWQIGSFLALGFLACSAAWVATWIFVPRARDAGTMTRASVLGSVTGALVLGTCVTVAFGVLFWFSELDRPRTYDRYEWEARWLTGAIGGAAMGAVLGLIVGAIRRRRA